MATGTTAERQQENPLVEGLERLSQAGAAFYPWEDEADETPMYRFVCSFATTAGEIETFKDCLKL